MSQKPKEVMADFQFFCEFFYRALHETPDAEFLEQVSHLPLEEIWSSDHVNADIEAGLKLLKNDLSGTDIEALSQDYAQLFIGPEKLGAAPWGSVYLTEEQTICGDSTLAVKAFYREAGLELDTGANEPEDHLGLMFAFLGQQFSNLFDAIEQNQQPDQVLSRVSNFLTHHVLTWAPRFLDVLHQNAGTDFYRGLALLIKGSLQPMASSTGANYKVVRLYR